MIQSPPRTILEVFESLPEGTLCQLINNNLVMTPSPDFWHQDIVTEISMQLRQFVNKKSLGKVVVAPMDVYFGRRNVYQPDILFLSNERMHLVQEGKIKGAPDLIVEVLSPATAHYDLEDKKAIYEPYGVQEYWIVEPATKRVTGYQLRENEFVEISAATGLIQSNLLGITISF